MSTEKRVFSRMFDGDKHQARLRAEKRKADNLKKVALGLVDELLVDLETLSDSTDQLAYFTDEWFEEKFDEWRTLGREIYDVYYNNAETLIEPADVDTDRDTLAEIKQKAEELGLSVEDVYPEYEDHIFNLDYLDEKHEKFLENKDLFRIESNV
jgi:hypothetical protein